MGTLRPPVQVPASLSHLPWGAGGKGVGGAVVTTLTWVSKRLPGRQGGWYERPRRELSG